jgi:release factor glutamine methyltransferase
VRTSEALRHGEEYLAGCEVEEARVDAELLLGKVLGLNRTDLYADGTRELTEDEEDEFRALLEQRGRHEPTAYILGEWGFRRLTLRVDPRVLIPRQETEAVVERALAHIRELDAPEVLDVGTGSGAIALAIADEHRGASITAFDASDAALDVARENAESAGVAERVRLVAHDLTYGFGSRCFDLIVSNPPYVEPEEIESLQPEVRDWEPRKALVGTGMADAIATEALGALKAGGALVLEVGAGQAAGVAQTLRGRGYRHVLVTKDLAGIERVVEGKR